MREKILFLDLDGTLLDDQKQITPGNRRALAEALEAGHRVVIATGRPLKSALTQAKALGLDGPGCYLITFNGALPYDCGNKKALGRTALTAETMRLVVEEANRRGIHVQAGDEKDVLVEPRNDDEIVRWYCKRIGQDYRVVPSLRDPTLPPSIKLLLMDLNDQTPLAEMQSWLRETLPEQTDCFFSCRELLEVMPAGIHKGTGVLEMCRMLGIPVENAVAVGDEANDLTMIQAAGVGVAMANAIPALKAVADYVTQNDNNHDGIAEVIHRFLLEPAQSVSRRNKTGNSRRP